MGWEEQVRRVVPYIPGEQPKQKGIIKLNTNECPYPPSPLVKEYAAAFETELLRLYPDPEASLLVNALADYYGVDAYQVFVGVGSDDVLAMSFLTFFNSEKPVLFPDITYSFYDVWAELFHIPYRCPELDNDFRLVKEDYLTENGGIVIPNPNAPTGLFESLDTIEEIVAGNPDSMVIIDEAYVDFGGVSAMSLVDKYDNLLVVQTFSKSRAMAGIRIGFAVGSKKAIGYLKDVAGLGFTFPDSMSNFIFASHETIPAAELFQALKQEGIYVRYFNKPRIDNYLRITVGTDEEMDRLLTFLKQIIH